MSVEIDPRWLGDDGAGDSWEGGERRIRLWRDGGVHAAVRVQLRIARNLASGSGTVIDVTGRSSAWEDLFKEDFNHETNTPQRQVIEIKRIEGGRPVLVYGAADLPWIGAAPPAP